jgi:membrane associated rhomboid family serine protease/tetratricopeptide (TPR) repeat protein
MMDSAPTPPDQPAGPTGPDAPVQAAEERQEITVGELLRHITPVAWVTPTLTILIVIGFGVEIALGVSATDPTGGQLLNAGGQFGPSFAAGQWWRVLTSMFLHSGPLHLAFNVWAFWSVGQLTERVFGNRSFLAIYLLSGIGASLTSVAWSPLTVSVGASGAIFGVYGALLAFVVLHRGVFPAEYLAQHRNSILGFLGYNVVFGLSRTNTDMAAHAGGFVAGALIGSVLGRDVLRPREHAGRRLAITAGLAALLALAALGVRARTLKVPEIRADREAEAARADFEAKRYVEAIEHYTAAIAIRREYPFLFNRSLAYYGLDDLKAAQRDMLDAHAMKPSAKTLGSLCEIGVRLGASSEEAALEEADRHCSDAITGAENPNQKAMLLAMRGLTRGMQKRNAESRSDVDAALALDEHVVMARAQRVSLHLDANELIEAEQDCAKLLAEPTPRAFDFDVCSRVSRAQNDRVKERERIDRLLAIQPTHTYALQTRAWLNGRENRLAESVADCTALVAVAPDNAWAWNQRAWVQVELGDFAAARSDADRAVALMPDSASFRGTRCFALAGLGELTAAREDCARALELQPTLVDRGMLAFIDKRRDDARRDWKRASEDDPVVERELRAWLAKLGSR